MISVGSFFGGGGLGVAFDGVDGGVPAEGGALDAGGKLVHAGEGGEIGHLVVLHVAGGDEFMDRAGDGLGFRDGLALEVERHERGGSLRDRTAAALETDISNAVAFERGVHRDLVAAQRVVAGADAIGGGQDLVVPRAAVVVENDGLVEFGEVLHSREWETPKLRYVAALANRVSGATLTSIFGEDARNRDNTEYATPCCRPQRCTVCGQSEPEREFILVFSGSICRCADREIRRFH